MNKIEQLTTELQKVGGVSFVSVIYTNDNNETSQTTFNVGISYPKAKAKDLEYLKTLDITELNSTTDKEILQEAKQSLINDFEKLANGNKVVKTNTTNIAPGLNIDNDTKELYVYGMQVNRKTLDEGEYGEVKQKPLTKAKNEIRKHLSTSKFRKYKINNMGSFKINNNTITFE